MTTAYLESLNAWNNKPRQHYVRERKKWQRVFEGTLFLWGRGVGRRKLVVVRRVSSAQQLIKDRDNLVGSLKPCKDILTRIGVLRDDSDIWLEFEISQDVDKTYPRVEFQVTDIS